MSSLKSYDIVMSDLGHLQASYIRSIDRRLHEVKQPVDEVSEAPLRSNGGSSREETFSRLENQRAHWSKTERSGHFADKKNPA